MKRLRLYLDTTVWNFPFADDAPEKQADTLDFFQRVRYGTFEIFTSQVVLEELEGAPEPRRSQVMKLWQETSHVRLGIPAEARELALLYLKKKGPSRAFSGGRVACGPDYYSSNGCAGELEFQTPSQLEQTFKTGFRKPQSGL